MYFHSNVRLLGDTSKHCEGLVPILLNSITLLVVVAGAGKGAIVWYALFVVNPIVGLSSCTERVNIALVVAGVGLLEITG